MPTLENLSEMLDKENETEVKVSNLTAAERKYLEEQNVDLSSGVIKIMRKSPKAPEAEVKPQVEKKEVPDLESVSDVLPLAKESAKKEEEEKAPAVEVSAADVGEYLRTVLGMLPFKYTYTMLGGKVRATFRTRTAAHNLALLAYGPQVRDKYGILDREAASVEMFKLQLVMTLDSLIVDNVSIPLPNVKPNMAYISISNEANTWASTIPNFIYSLCINKLAEFDNYVSALEKAINDQNF